MNTDCTVVFYHYIRDVARTSFPGTKGLSPAEFSAQLDWLESQMRIIDGPTFERAALGAERLPTETALLTFDDGFVDHYENAYPELKARGVGGMFFVSGATLDPQPMLLNVHKTHFLLSTLGAEQFGQDVADCLAAAGHRSSSPADAREGVYRYDEAPDVRAKRQLNYELPYEVADAVLDELFRRYLGDPVRFARALYLTPDMIAEMARGGMTFGYHTRTHRVLSRLPRAEQERELMDGVALIRRLTGQQAVPFCYPYGFSHTYDRDTLDVLSDAGYSVAFTTARRPASLPAASRYEVPRFDTRDLPKQPGAQVHA